jgi:tetratricopeptide (TPR) repeat protein
MADWEEYKNSAEKAQREGKYSFAEHVWLAALEEAEDWAENDKRRGYTLEKLCECLWYQGKFPDAIPYCEKLVIFQRKTLGDTHVDTGSMIGNLAMLYHAQSLYKEAEPFYKQAIAIKEQHLGSNHQEVLRLKSVYADVLNNLKHQKKDASELTARLWSRTGRHPAFPKEGNPTPAAAPTSLDPEKQYVALRERAEKLSNDGALDAAEAAWHQAFSVAEKFGPNDYRLCQALEQLSALCERQEQFRKSLMYSGKALEIKKRVFGTKHLHVATALNDMARLLYYACELPEAEKFAVDCLKVYESIHGKQHPSVASAANNLAMLYHVQKKYTAAEPYYKQSLNIRAQLLGSEHPDTIRVLSEYANLLKATFREDEAEHLKACIAGILTGSWKVIPISAEQQLVESEDKCAFCGGKLNGAIKCKICGTENPKSSRQPISK